MDFKTMAFRNITDLTEYAYTQLTTQGAFKYHGVEFFMPLRYPLESMEINDTVATGTQVNDKLKELFKK